MKNLFKKYKVNEQTVYSASGAVAIVAAGFCLIICVLLIANYLQTKAVDPLNNKALETLIQKLDENPVDDELREQIRAVHLLSRKAYFVHQWQLQTGGVLLLVGVIVLLAAVKIRQNLDQKLPNPEDFSDSNLSWQALEQARNWMAGLGIFILGTAIIFATLSYREMDRSFAGTGERASLIIKNESATALSPEPAATINQEATRFWPNFRGPGGMGVANMDNPPRDWDIESGRHIMWAVPVPQNGFSSPVVWGNRLFLTGANKEIREVYCFDTESGEILWQKTVGSSATGPSLPDVGHFAGYASPTVATNGKFVGALFGTGDLACFDMAGQEIWVHNLGIPDNHYGHSSSLIIHENLLIVQYDQKSNSKLYAYDMASGNVAWTADRTVISWSSPICVNTGNRMELIVVNSKTVASYNPNTGDQFWSIDCMEGEMGPSPAFADGMVYAANEYARAVGLRLNGNSVEIAWQFDEELPESASLLATAKYVYIATSYGMLICLDAKTGEQLWDAEFDAGFYASPVLAGNLVYAMDRQGIMHIFEPGDEYKSVADIAIGEPSDCTPALVNNRLYIRGKKQLYCITRD